MKYQCYLNNITKKVNYLLTQNNNMFQIKNYNYRGCYVAYETTGNHQSVINTFDVTSSIARPLIRATPKG